MIKLYAAPRTRAFRILWLLEELGLEHELCKIAFKPTSDAFYIQDTPTGKIPTLEDGDVLICESGAIVQYILERYGNGQLEPAVNAPERGTYLQWLHYSEASAFAPLGNIVWLTQYRSDAEENAQLIADSGSRAKAALGFIEEQIKPGAYLAGDDFTAADIMMGFTLLAAELLGQLSPEVFPKLQDYLTRLKQRPAFQSAFMKLHA